MTHAPFDDEPTRPDRPGVEAMIEIDRLRTENAQLKQRLEWIVELASLGGRVVQNGTGIVEG